jgi:hypothetical protein
MGLWQCHEGDGHLRPANLSGRGKRAGPSPRLSTAPLVPEVASMFSIQHVGYGGIQVFDV